MSEKRNITSLSQLSSPSGTKPEVKEVQEQEVSQAVQPKTVKAHEVKKVSADEMFPNRHKEKEDDSYMSVIKEMSDKKLAEKVELANEKIAEKILEQEEKEEDEFNDLDKDEDATFSGEEESEDEDDDDFDEEEEVVISNIKVDDSDFDDLDEEDDEDLDEEAETIKKNQEVVKEQLSKYIKPVHNKYDLSEFTISNKSESVVKLFSGQDDAVMVEDCYLPDSDMLLAMKRFKGKDIVALDTNNGSKSLKNKQLEAYTTIFNNIVNRDDKLTLDEFLQSVRFSDVDSLYFGIYHATYGDENPYPYECTNPKCRKVFTNEISTEDIVQFKTDADKTKFYDKMNAANKMIQKKTEYDSTLRQLSDNLVVSVMHPSIYTVMIESLTVSEQFRTKYEDIISSSYYIDKFYQIDAETKTLVEIKYKKYKNDINKTFKSKIKYIATILNELESDEFSSLNALIAKYIEDTSSTISYYVPGATCPHCGTKISKQQVSPQELVFLRHQFGAMVSY